MKAYNMRVGVAVFVAFCFGSLTFLFSVDILREDILFPCISIALVVATVLWIVLKIDDVSTNIIDSHYLTKSLAIITSACTYNILYNQYRKSFHTLFEYRLEFDKREELFVVVTVSACVALALYYVYLFNYLNRNVINKILCNLTNYEKTLFISFVIIFFLLTIGIHTKTSGFDYAYYIASNGEIERSQFDAIMDCDSYSVFYHLKQFSYNLRHPFFSLVALPEYALSSAISNVFSMPSQFLMVLLSVFNIMKAAICGICISRLSKSRIALVLYYCSFPVWIYSLTIERHMWSLFWIVLAVYMATETRGEYYMPIILSGGANIMSVAITPVIIIAKSTREYVKKIMLLAISFVITIIAYGRLSNLIRMADDLKKEINNAGTLTIFSRLASFTTAMKCSIGGIVVDYRSDYSTYYTESTISIIGILIIFAIISTIVHFRKHHYIGICGYWIGIAVLLFSIIGFSQGEVSMHAILFSWAIISVLSVLYETIIERFQTNKVIVCFTNVVVLVFFGWELVTNIKVLYELIGWASRFNYLFR